MVSSGHSKQGRDEHLTQARPLASVLRLNSREGKLLLADASKGTDEPAHWQLPQTLASWPLILQASVKSKTASSMRLRHGICTESLCLPDSKPDAAGA